MKRCGALLIATLAFVSCRTTEPPVPPSRDVAAVSFLVESREPAADRAVLPLSGVEIPVASQPVVDAAGLANVELAPTELGTGLRFELTPDAAAAVNRSAAVTENLRLVLVVNGAALGTVRLGAPVRERRVQLLVEVPDAELAELVLGLKQGLRARK